MEIVTVDVQGSPMEVFLFLPETGGPHPGLVLAQHIPVGHTGVENDEFTLATARRFAANGFAVAVPFIFHWWPKDADIQVKRDESRAPFLRVLRLGAVLIFLLLAVFFRALGLRFTGHNVASDHCGAGGQRDGEHKLGSLLTQRNGFHLGGLP